MEKPRTANPVSPFTVLNQNLIRLSTQVEYDTLDLESAISLARECFGLAVNGTEVEQRAGRAAGGNLAALSDAVRKQTAAALNIPAPIVKKYVNDAAVPETDYTRWVEEKRKKGKKLTDAGLRRIGKPQNKRQKLTAAGRVIRGLTPWLDSMLLKSVGRGEYAGTPAELAEVAALLTSLAAQFCTYAGQINQGKN